MRCASSFPERTSVLALLLFALPCVIAPPASAGGRAEPTPTTIESLLTHLRSLGGLEAKYREEQHLSLLAAPLVSEGTLHFAPPDRLARHTLTPVKSSVIIDAKQVVFGDAKKQESVDLQGNPYARLFVETFVRILSGDRAWLEKNYKLALKSEAEGWTLRLVPAAASMQKALTAIELSGRDLELQRLRMIETSGDETVTTFTEVDTTKRYTPEELARVFSLGPRGK